MLAKDGTLSVQEFVPVYQGLEEGLLGRVSQLDGSTGYTRSFAGRLGGPKELCNEQKHFANPLFALPGDSIRQVGCCRLSGALATLA